ncbi:transglutaminase-like cysteine peptidase [Sedimentimonas flavescens]|uniref:Transglutaminase-like cysteine peptidase n=1 Tax=Sedimentimonas flavescens TaxID=2851012 RepID=A0ABT2ZYI6_9RHOB|nr:transglutaminase-like cysteine peptidase [Sedimentimonas flavescens]MCV2878813.1 transglutaminase-like cysteine peptidase [Sedimentimonas flavescens]WBL31999.1 transglutaminase-like cysteine peptidase [Sinirhodobacter sp. HNIBRBA609]
MTDTSFRANLRRALSGAILAGLGLGLLLTPQSADAIMSTAFLQSRGAAPAPSGARALCQQYDWACATSQAPVQRVADEFRLIKAVNSQVNRAVRSIDDKRQYGVAENWALPTKRGGDCEDFALLKKYELIRRGIDPQRLLIATALDRKRNPHAVLIYRSDQGDYVLDNLTSQVKTWKSTRYFFLRMQDPAKPSRWMNVLRGA